MAIHPTAIIDPGAELASNVEVGAYCIVDAGVRLGEGCRLMHHAWVTGDTTIERDCVIHPGAIIGHEPQDVKYDGAATGCHIGAGTVIREHVTIHRGTTPGSVTRVGRRCFLLAGAHVAHNCVVEDDVTMINNVLLAGHVTVGEGAVIGGGAAVHQFVRIGALSMVAGLARVPQDVLPFAMLPTDGRVAGLNRVGLRRAGYSQAEIAEIRTAYKRIFSHERGVPELSGTGGGIACLAAFLSGESRRGWAGRSRRVSRE